MFIYSFRQSPFKGRPKTDVKYNYFHSEYPPASEHEIFPRGYASDNNEELSLVYNGFNLPKQLPTLGRRNSLTKGKRQCSSEGKIKLESMMTYYTGVLSMALRISSLRGKTTSHLLTGRWPSLGGRWCSVSRGRALRRRDGNKRR